MARFAIVIGIIGNGFNTLKKRSEFVNHITAHMKNVADGFVVIETNAALVPEGETLSGLLLKYGSLSMSKIISEIGCCPIAEEELKSAKKKLEMIQAFNIPNEHEIIIFCEKLCARIVKFLARRLFDGRIIVVPFNSGKSYKEKLKQLFIVTPLAILAFYFPKFEWLQRKQCEILN
jgi:hypothetical protein